MISKFESSGTPSISFQTMLEIVESSLMPMSDAKLARKNLVSCRDLGLDFPGPVTALSGVTCDLQQGELISIVGPSGCGKSTLLRLMAGLIHPTSGRIEIDSASEHSASGGRLQVGFVFQDATLLPWRTIQDNIRLPFELLGTAKQDHAEKIEQSLRLVGLKDFARAFPSQLSGGMRMRAALVRALITQPGLVLLDEPFGALDEITRQRLHEDLLGLWQQQQWSAVFITHNVMEAVFLSQRVLVMSPRPGRVVAEFSIPFQYPRTSELRGSAEFAKLAEEISQCLKRTAS